MFDFPITLSIHGKLVVVVGYGSVGKRKVATLLLGGARVRVIDPAAIIDPVPEGVEFLNKKFAPLDIDSAHLVCVAVDDVDVENEVVAVAKSAGIMVNVAGSPEKGDFAMPAVLRRGAIKVAVSTDGKSPAGAVAVRDLIAGVLDPEWGELIEVISRIRGDRLTESRCSEYNCKVLGKLSESELLMLITENDREGLEVVLDRLKQR